MLVSAGSKCSPKTPTPTIKIGAQTTLTATVSPSNATDRAVTWSSSDTRVATVSSSGVVTGKAAGSVVITARTSNGRSDTCTVKVTVSNSNVPVASVTVSPATVILPKGTYNELSAGVSPSNATEKVVSWSSSNTAVVTVSSGGVVMGKSAGTATITATAGGKSARCVVTVPPAVAYATVQWVEQLRVTLSNNTVYKYDEWCWAASSEMIGRKSLQIET